MVNPKALRVLGSAFCFCVNKFHKVKGITGLLPVFSVDCAIWNFFLMINFLKSRQSFILLYNFQYVFLRRLFIAASRIVMSIYILILYNSKLQRWISFYCLLEFFKNKLAELSGWTE